MCCIGIGELRERALQNQGVAAAESRRVGWFDPTENIGSLCEIFLLFAGVSRLGFFVIVL